MTPGNADLVSEYFAAYDRGGLDAWAEYWHPEIAWRAAEGAVDDVGLMEGADALRRYYEAWEETFDEIRTEVEESFEVGDRVVAVVRGLARMKGSESQVDVRYAIVLEIRDGKIVSGREYFTREEALSAAGLDATSTGK
jgi:ketosteroid isomerase-like protein